MRTFTFILSGLVATTVAQSSSQYYNLQSAAFRLVLNTTTHPSLHGRLLVACHQGAAIEGLCLSNLTVSDPPASFETFYHNVSSSAGNSVNATDTNGILNYRLTISGGLQVPSAMTLSQNLASNLADPIFRPGSTTYQLVAFDECESMYIPAYLNDQISPPAPYQPVRKLKSWYICLTRYAYLYTTLAFKIGVTGEAQNPTCQSVEVVRVWV